MWFLCTSVHEEDGLCDDCSESEFWVCKLFKMSSDFLKKDIKVICLLYVLFVYYPDLNEI